jgi:hypothetical protein
MLGTCKLCTFEKDLQDSHLLPRALYKKAHGSGTKGNQDPHVVTVRGRRPSSHQVTDYVLCRDCEQRFNKNGEDYVMRLVTQQNGEFPLLEALNSIPSQQSGKNFAAYSAAGTSDIDRDKIGYFAISVFWRASVHTWKQENGELVSIDLGKKYNEEIRRYLLGETAIPKQAALIVAACTDSESQISFYVPSENRRVKDQSVGFGARGLFFMLRMSKTNALWQRRLSMINNQHGWISVWDCLERGVWRLGAGREGDAR